MNNSSSSYVILGSNGYIAPRHSKAIKENGGILKSIIDIDFDNFVNIYPKKIKKFYSLHDYLNNEINLADFMCICSPNHLHEDQIESSLKAGMNIICEKPVAMSLEGLKKLQNIEKISPGKVNSIFQMRLHPEILKLKKKVSNREKYKIEFYYVGRRNIDYFNTWKGKDSLSGGIITNIGVHYFDLLLNIFGDYKNIEIKDNSTYKSSGEMQLENGNVSWLISFDEKDKKKYLAKDLNSFRLLKVNDKELNLGYINQDLHSLSYKEILNGNGFSLDDAKMSIKFIDDVKKL